MKSVNLAVAASAAALLFAPATVVLAQEKGEMVSEDSAKADDDATVRCKRMPPPVGSRTGGKKVCKTNAAWRLEQEAAAQAARENQDRSATGNTRTSG